MRKDAVGPLWLWPLSFGVLSLTSHVIRDHYEYGHEPASYVAISLLVPLIGGAFWGAVVYTALKHFAVRDQSR